jgi:transposase
MDSPMPMSIKRKAASTDIKKVRQRRSFSQEFKQEAWQMLLDGHSAVSVAERQRLPGANLLCRWKRDAPRQAGPAARTLGDRVSQLEKELRRVVRERDT